MINNKHVYTRTLREEENIEYDDLVSTYISTSDYSLNVKDYENELSKDRVTLTNTKNPKGNLYANQSWIIEIAGLSVDNADNTLLNNVKYSKVILKDGSIKNLTKSDCKAIAETLYNSIQRYTDITAFLHNELYDYKQNRPLMDKVAECWKGNGKFHIDAIEPKNEDYLSLPIDANGTTQPITNPKDFSEFIMYYLKDWYNVVRFANTSKYPLIYNLALYFATNESVKDGLGKIDSNSFADEPYNLMLDRLGYFLVQSAIPNKFSTDSIRDILRTDGKTLSYYLGERRAYGKSSISLDDTTSGKDDDNMANEERVGFVDDNFNRIDNEDTVKKLVNFINTDFYNMLKVPENIEFTTYHSGNDNSWVKVDCTKPFHWSNIFSIDELTDIIIDKLSSLTKKSIDKSNLFGANGIFNANENEELVLNNNILDSLQESTKFSKYERILEESEKLIEATKIDSTTENLISLLTQQKLDFDEDGIANRTGTPSVDSSFKIILGNNFNENNYKYALDIIYSKTSKEIANSLSIYGMAKLYGFFKSGMLGYGLMSQDNYAKCAYALFDKIYDDYNENGYTLNKKEIVSALNEIIILDTKNISSKYTDISPDKYESDLKDKLGELGFDSTDIQPTIKGFARCYIYLKEKYLVPSNEKNDDVLKILNKGIKTVSNGLNDRFNINNYSKSDIISSKDSTPIGIIINTIRSIIHDKGRNFKNKKEIVNTDTLSKIIEACSGYLPNGNPVTIDAYGYLYCKNYSALLLAKALIEKNIVITNTKFDLRTGLMCTGCFPYSPVILQKGNMITFNESAGIKNINAETTKNNYVFGYSFKTDFGKYNINNTNQYLNFIKAIYMIRNNNDNNITSIPGIKEFLRKIEGIASSIGVDSKLINFIPNNSDVRLSLFNNFFSNGSNIIAESKINDADNRLFESIYNESLNNK